MAPQAAKGPFEMRFPLLAAYLARLPQTGGLEPRARLDPLKTNFEFSVFVDPAALDGLLAASAPRKLTLLTYPEDAGSGLRRRHGRDQGYRQRHHVAAPGGAPAKGRHSLASPRGPSKFFEYYPSTD